MRCRITNTRRKSCKDKTCFDSVAHYLVYAGKQFSACFGCFLAATCSGIGCNGSFASSTGCGNSVTNVKTIYPASSRVDLRYSTNCYTLWAKTTNTDGLGRSFYANATLWFQSSPYYYSVSSGGKIAVNKTVVSQQRYSGIANPPGWLACGHISANPISAPVGSPCTP
ncbi:MAG: DUF2690 domain-containing protein [Chloroflexota bacterium]